MCHSRASNRETNELLGIIHNHKHLYLDCFVFEICHGSQIPMSKRGSDLRTFYITMQLTH